MYPGTVAGGRGLEPDRDPRGHLRTGGSASAVTHAARLDLLAPNHHHIRTPSAHNRAQHGILGPLFVGANLVSFWSRRGSISTALVVEFTGFQEDSRII